MRKKGVFSTQFWLNLGSSYSSIGEYQAAIDSFSRAIDENPENPEGYLLSATAYTALNDYEDALSTCDVGILLAESNKSAPWSRKLYKQLIDEKSRIEIEYQKSKYGTFSS